MCTLLQKPSNRHRKQSSKTGVRSHLRSSAWMTKEQVTKLRKILARQTSVTIDELKRIAVQTNLPEARCLNWFQQHGVLVEGRSQKSVAGRPYANFGFASLEQNWKKISYRTKGSFTRLQSSFFWKLPFHTQVAMLKRTRDVASTTTQVARELSDTFHLPLDKLQLWVKCRRKRLQKIAVNPKLTAEKSALLRAEFAKNSRINEDQALVLSHLFGLSVRTVLHYYSVRRAKLKYKQSTNEKKQENVRAEISKKEVKKAPSSPTFIVMPKRMGAMKCKSGRFFSPDQLTTLFEEFKHNPAPDSERCASLAAATGLSALQITNWFNKLRPRLELKKINEVFKSLNENLQPFQLTELERMYRQAKYLLSDEAYSLSQKLQISKHAVILWFSRRRMYELLKYQTGDTDGNESVTAGWKTSDANLADEPATVEPELEMKFGPRSTFIGNLPALKRVRLFKLYKTMRYRDVSRVAQDLDLPVEKVHTWFKNRRYTDMRLQKRKQQPVVLPTNKVCYSERRSINRFTPEQVQILESKFAESDRVTKDEATELAQSSAFGGLITSNQIQNWYMNKRQKLKFIQRKEGITGPTSSTHGQKSSPDVMDIQNPEPASKIAAQGQKSVMQNHTLFLEFKKSTSLPASRLKDLSKRCHLTNMQIICWFNNLRKRLSAKTLEDVTRILKLSLSVTQIKRLCAEYSKFRYCSTTRMVRMAEQLNVTKGTVQHWFNNARYYELLTGEKFKLKLEPSYNPPEDDYPEDNPPEDNSPEHATFTENKFEPKLTWPQIQGLKKAFREDENITDERAKILARQWKIRAEKIKAWFENRMTLVSRSRENGIPEPEDDAVDEPEELGSDIESTDTEDMQNMRTISVLIPKMKTTSPLGSKNQKYLKLPLQQDALFEAFKQSPEVSPARMAELCARLDLTERQISNWFRWMRTKLATLSGEILLPSYRNRNLTAEQVVVLEAEFKRHPYLDQESRDKLAASLQVSRGTVKMWFANRRYYDIVSHSNGGANSLDYGGRIKFGNCKPGKTDDDDQFEISVEVETVPFNGAGADVPFQPVITSITSAGEKTGVEHDAIEMDSENESELLPCNDYVFIDSDGETLPRCDDPVVAIKQELCSDASEHEDPIEKLGQVALEADEVTLEPSDFENRPRYREPLTEDAELTQSEVNSTFWYACSDPSSQHRDVSTPLSDADIAVLEAMFVDNPRPSLSEMHEFADRLRVSDQAVYWWFVRKRFATKDRSEVEADTASAASNSSHDEDYLSAIFGLPETDVGSADKQTEPRSVEVEFVAFDDDGVDSGAYVNENSADESNSPAQVNGDVFSEVTMKAARADVASNSSKREQNPVGEPGNRAATVGDAKRDMGKKKKLVMSIHQRTILLQEYRRSPFVSAAKARMLATDLGLSVKRVEQWFEKKRHLSAKSAGAEGGVESPEAPIEPLTEAQKVALEAEYAQDSRLTKLRLSQLVHRLQVRKRTVILWFKEKKEKEFPAQSSFDKLEDKEFPLLSQVDGENLTERSPSDVTST